MIAIGIIKVSLQSYYNFLEKLELDSCFLLSRDYKKHLLI
jgi:hypothetical protein